MEAKTPKTRGSERTADMKEWEKTKSRRKSKGPRNKNRIGEDQVCESVSGSPLNKFNKPVSLRRSLDPDDSFLSVSSSSLISYKSCRHSRREVLQNQSVFTLHFLCFTVERIDKLTGSGENAWKPDRLHNIAVDPARFMQSFSSSAWKRWKFVYNQWQNTFTVDCLLIIYCLM